MTTRDRIIETAVSLFNSKGTAAITTNHIAAAARISPGNLYYHFRNKEEIIRAAFDQMDAYGAEEYGRIAARLVTAETVASTFVVIQKFNWRYRFFKREMTALVAADRALKRRFVRTHRQMAAMIRTAVDQSVEQGVLREMSSPEREALTDELWLVTLFWLNYLELGGEKINQQTLARGNAVLLEILASRATPGGLAILHSATALKAASRE